MRPLLALVVAMGCGTKDSAPTTAPTGTTASGTPTAGTTTTGTPSTATGTPSTGTTGTGTVPLTFGYGDAECGMGTTPPPGEISVSLGGPRELAVQHTGFGDGCCPTFTLGAVANHGTGRIHVTYSTEPDPCECICTLDASYVLQGVPDGTWTVEAAGATSPPVTLP